MKEKQKFSATAALFKYYTDSIASIFRVLKNL